MVIEPGFVGHRFARVFGRSRELEGLGSVEGRGESDFARFEGVGLFRQVLLDGRRGMVGLDLTPRRVAFAAALAFAFFLEGPGPGFFCSG